MISTKKGRRKNYFYLLIILIILSVLPVLIVGGLSISYFNNYVGNQLTETYKARLLQLETDLDQKIADINEAVNILVLATAHLELDTISRQSISDFQTIEMVYTVWDLMNTLKQTSQFIHSIYYLNSDKTFLLSSEKDALSIDTFYDQLWVESITEDIGYNELPPRILPGAAMTPVLTRIISTRGFITGSGGYFVVNVNLDELTEWIDALNENQQTDFFVYNAKDSFIAGTGSDPQQLPETLSGKIHFRSQSESGWKYLLTIPSRFFYSFLNRTILVMVLMTGILLVLVILFSIYVSNRLYSPIENVIRIIEDGEAIVPDSPNEIAFIGDLFVKMIQEQTGLRNVLEQNSQAIKESLLRRLFLGDPVDRALVLDKLNDNKNPIESCLYCSAIVLLLSKGANISVSDTGPAQAMAVRAYESENSENIRVLGVPLDMERIALLISAEDSLQIEKVLLRVRSFLESSLTMEPLVAVGGLYKSIDEIVDSFSEALNLLDSTIPDLNEQIIFHREADLPVENQRINNNYPWALEAQLIQVLKQGDKKRAERLVKDFMEEISRKDFSHRDLVEVSILSLISGIVRAMGVKDQGNYYRDFLNHDTSIKKAENWLVSFIEHFLETPSDRDPREEKYRIMIQEYIQDNYHRDISLELIADWTGISYSYLRKIFSTLFDSNFLDYIHSIRIEKARELLRETNQNIGEIAQSVGYMNTARLNRNFNKIIGCTPTEYRIRVRKSLME